MALSLKVVNTLLSTEILFSVLAVLSLLQNKVSLFWEITIFFQVQRQYKDYL